ncbi:hypothetical protein RRG08_009633 [Elysia crispata]|uniref:Uncharacterized protein n=1 Tax=Elysia crispata TaxID=231223 RepID=A0AAE1CLR5_9GAST|nr:hypothetical protein RRG08_009633 [Elysia crispata]
MNRQHNKSLDHKQSLQTSTHPLHTTNKMWRKVFTMDRSLSQRGGVIVWRQSACVHHGFLVSRDCSSSASYRPAREGSTAWPDG